MATNFEPHECVIFAQSTKIGTHENKAIHSKLWTWSAVLDYYSHIISYMKTMFLFKFWVQLKFLKSKNY